MVGSVGQQGLLLGVLFVQATAQECDMFRQEFCNLSQGTVLMVNAKIYSPAKCQTACFERARCTEFTYFAGEERKCILFKSCSNPKSSCDNCISGPAWPRVSNCLSQAQQDRRRSKQSGGRGRSGSGRSDKAGTSVNNYNDYKSDDDIEPDRNDDKDNKDEDDEDVEDDDINIDEGLLDDIFEDLPGMDNRSAKKPTRKLPNKVKNTGKGSNKGGCPSCDNFYYCAMGGSNANGPISTVSVMNIGKHSVPSSPLISPFPSFMTLGNGGTFSSFSSSALHTCTPGYQVSTLVGPYFRDRRIQSSYVPGSCNGYNFRTGLWTSTGGRMTAFRNGGSTLNVGSYILSLGGFDPFGQTVSSVELFDPRRPQIGWHDVPRWSYPRATMDQCMVVTRDPKLGTQVMVMGGLGEEYSATKLVLSTNNWYSVPPMNHPRAQHGCTSVTLNGRPGVVVSGGVDANRFNTSSVEFFDMKTHRWINLPDLSRGRRGHTMTTIEGQMAVAGGTTTGFRGDTEYLDDVEVFDGRRWKRANYRLDQPRNGANLVKIPIRTFYG
eukprot:GFUD01012924.1.p1 GENE.GFUD01012924.1~~GFUD01012924.1.p1  ORF type:complete len:559 (-),score=123.56 GFUD01012924.1:109-1755(-)